MNTETWERAKIVFDEALRLLPSARDAFVANCCSDDSQLRGEIFSLLQAHEADKAFLQHPLTLPDLSPSIGDSIGAYRLIRLLGRGGMGAVYLAERADGSFEKRVAIKVISQPSPELTATILNERRILAALDHPHIARLLDAGLLQDNTPYFVMEFVEGKPLYSYCEENQLSLFDRIKLFLQVASAVEYAHRHLVVHSDIKSANVLVDAEGSSKLLDFGVARKSGIAPGGFGDLGRCTPEFASPEQLRGDSTDERSDIYSLGVLLFVLLTRQSPYGQRAASLLQFIEAVQRDAPLIASRAVLQAAASDPAGAREARQRGRRISPDLDAILAKALKKEADERYPSVTLMAEDLRNFLTKQPVTARPRRWMERSWNFVHRYRWVTAVSLLGVLFLVAGLGVWGKMRSGEWSPPRPSLAVLPLTDSSDKSGKGWVGAAITELLRSELASSTHFRLLADERVLHATGALDASALFTTYRVAQVSRILSSDYLLSGTIDRQQGKITVRARLIRVKGRDLVADVEESGDEDDLTAVAGSVAARLVSIAGVQRQRHRERSAPDDALASNPPALKLYMQGIVRLRAGDALRSRESLSKAAALAPDSPMVHAALARNWALSGYDNQALEQARLAYARAGRLGREDRLALEAGWQEAAKDWAKAIDSYKTLFIAVPDEIEYGLSLISAQVAGEKLQDALATVRKLRAAKLPPGDEGRIDLAEASIYAAMPNNKRVLDLAQHAIDRSEKTGFAFLRAQALMSEASAWHALAKYQACLQAAREAQGIYDRQGDVQASLVARNLIANVQYNTGHRADAKQMYTELLMLSRALGYDRGTASGLNNLSNVLSDEGDYETAIRLSKECVEISQRLNDGRRLALALNNLANHYLNDGRGDLALRAYERSLNISVKQQDILHQAMTIGNIGLVYMSNGDYPRARVAEERSLELHREAENPTFFAPTLTVLAHTDWAMGRMREACDDSTKAVDSARKLNTPGDLTYALARRAKVLHDLGDLRRSTADLREAYQICRETVPAMANSIQVDLASNELDEGDTPHALQMLDQVFTRRQEVSTSDRFGAYLIRAQALARLHRFGEAHQQLALAGQIAPRELEVESRINLTLAKALVARLEDQRSEAVKQSLAALAVCHKRQLIPLMIAAQTELALLSANPQTIQQARDSAGRYGLRFYQLQLTANRPD